MPDKNGQPTVEELKAQLAKLQAENAALVQQATSRLTMRVSKRGAVSLYGLGRFPVTLYPEQWAKVLDKGTDIRNFCKGNEGIIKAAQEKFAKMTEEEQAAFLKAE